MTYRYLFFLLLTFKIPQSAFTQTHIPNPIIPSLLQLLKPKEKCPETPEAWSLWLNKKRQDFPLKSSQAAKRYLNNIYKTLNECKKEEKNTWLFDDGHCLNPLWTLARIASTTNFALNGERIHNIPPYEEKYILTDTELNLLKSGLSKVFHFPKQIKDTSTTRSIKSEQSQLKWGSEEWENKQKKLEIEQLKLSLQPFLKELSKNSPTETQIETITAVKAPESSIAANKIIEIRLNNKSYLYINVNYIEGTMDQDLTVIYAQKTPNAPEEQDTLFFSIKEPSSSSKTPSGYKMAICLECHVNAELLEVHSGLSFHTTDFSYGPTQYDFEKRPDYQRKLKEINANIQERSGKTRQHNLSTTFQEIQKTSLARLMRRDFLQNDSDEDKKLLQNCLENANPEAKNLLLASSNPAAFLKNGINSCLKCHKSADSFYGSLFAHMRPDLGLLDMLHHKVIGSEMLNDPDIVEEEVRNAPIALKKEINSCLLKSYYGPLYSDNAPSIGRLLDSAFSTKKCKI